MGLKNKTNLDTANTVAEEKFGETFDGVAPGVWQLFAEVMSTGAERDNLVFASMLNSMREWLGAKEYGNLEAFSQTVILTKYELSLALERFRVEYDTTGAVGRALARWIENARGNSDDKILFDSLVSNSGEGPVGFDAVNLIDASHSLGGTTYSNKATSALSFSTYDSAIQTMMGYKTAALEPLNIFPTHLVVGPKLRKVALEITGADDRVQGVDATNSVGDEGATLTSVAAVSRVNVFRGQQDVVIWNRLTGTQDDYWYLLDLSKSDRPMIMKTERDWELISATDPTDSSRMSNDRYLYSIEADKALAAGAWPTIYGGIL